MEDEYLKEEKDHWLIKTIGRDITELIIYILISVILLCIYFALCLGLPTVKSEWFIPKLDGRYNTIFLTVAIIIFLGISFIWGDKQKGIKGIAKFLDILIMMLILWVMYIICLIPITKDMDQVVIYSMGIVRNWTIWQYALLIALPGRVVSYIKDLISNAINARKKNDSYNI